MNKNAPKRKNEAKNGILKRTKEVKGSYVMARSVKVGETIYKKGQQVEFSDKETEQLFLKNNYVV